MILADFVINVEFSIPRGVQVVVYDSVKGLRIAATRHENLGRSKTTTARGKFADTLGICHRFTWFDKDGKLKPVCAIVRLAVPNLGVGIIAHEMTHAAVWLHELNGDDAPITCSNDEPFAWTVGELVRQTINTMNKYGIYDED